MSVEIVRNYFKEHNINKEILEFPVSSATVELAAEAVGTEPARIAKTLSFYTKDPYKDLSTLSEIKLASAGIDSPVLGETFRAAGLTVEDIQTSKILQSLKSSSGVRGFFAVHMYAYVTGFYKSINYALNTKMCPVMAGFVISNSSWNKNSAAKPAFKLYFCIAPSSF